MTYEQCLMLKNVDLIRMSISVRATVSVTSHRAEPRGDAADMLMRVSVTRLAERGSSWTVGRDALGCAHDAAAADGRGRGRARLVGTGPLGIRRDPRGGSRAAGVGRRPTKPYSPVSSGHARPRGQGQHPGDAQFERLRRRLVRLVAFPQPIERVDPDAQAVDAVAHPRGSLIAWPTR